MAFVQKKTGLIHVDMEGNIFKTRNEVLLALEKGEAREVEYQDVLVYSQEDIIMCYRHHIEGHHKKNQHDKIYTVMAPADESEISLDNFKKLMEGVFKNVQITLVSKKTIKKGEIKIQFNMRDYKGYRFRNSKCEDYEDTRPVTLLSRDMIKIEFNPFAKKEKQIIIVQKNLERIRHPYVLSQNEINEVTAFFIESQNPETNYKIKNIWVIGHTDIRAYWPRQDSAE